jgi:hypothetical protein
MHGIVQPSETGRIRFLIFLDAPGFSPRKVGDRGVLYPRFFEHVSFANAFVALG